MRNSLFWVSAGVAGLLLGACAGGGAGSGASSGTMGDLPAGSDSAVGGISEVPNPSPAMAARSGKSLSQIERGHEVYMLKCGECHAYMLPHAVDIDDWEDSIPTMIRHAGLPSSDEQAVLDYVIAVKSE